MADVQKNLGGYKLGKTLDCIKLAVSKGYISLEEVEKIGGTNKYTRTIYGVEVDVYDVLVAWNVTCPATQHAIKKLLMPGQRGSKDKLQDLEEAGQAIERAIELNK